MDSAKTARQVAQRTSLRPKLGVVLGSGLSAVANCLQVRDAIPFSALPGFPTLTAPGHEGRLLLGTLGEVPILALCGRAHYYEGHTLDEVSFPIRVLADFGIEVLLLTNAAGAIHSGWHPGEFMLIRDHINFMGASPLRGPVPSGRERFMDCSEVYDRSLGRLLTRAAKRAKIPWRQGVYLGVAGPSYETPAEIRAFSRWGADAVGMSTVPEALAARHCGIRVAGVSCLTNLAAGLGQSILSHSEVETVGQAAVPRAMALLMEWVPMLGLD